MSQPLPKPRFTVTLEAPPTADDPDGVRRLRRFLKRAWRDWGLRCVDLGYAPTKPPKALGGPGKGKGIV
jgi:hypothetical protein